MMAMLLFIGDPLVPQMRSYLFSPGAGKKSYNICSSPEGSAHLGCSTCLLPMWVSFLADTFLLAILLRILPLMDPSPVLGTFPACPSPHTPLPTQSFPPQPLLQTQNVLVITTDWQQVLRGCLCVSNADALCPFSLPHCTLVSCAGLVRDEVLMDRALSVCLEHLSCNKG